MYTLQKGNVFDAIDDTKNNSNCVLLHGCNINGVMGAGIAKEVRERYPYANQVYTEYLQSLENPASALGKYCLASVENNFTIINGFTQKLERDINGKPCGAKVDYIKEILSKIDSESYFDQFDKFYTVQIGCGLGGLSWYDDVRDLFINVKREWLVYYI